MQLCVFDVVLCGKYWIPLLQAIWESSLLSPIETVKSMPSMTIPMVKTTGTAVQVGYQENAFSIMYGTGPEYHNLSILHSADMVAWPATH